MMLQKDFKELGCAECAGGAGLDFGFSMALQPIVDVDKRTVFAQEALVRGPSNNGAGEVFRHVNDSNRYRFDQACRVKAIKLAAEVGVQSMLSINFMPNAVYRPELCIRTTLKAAEEYGFPLEKIIFEITEGEQVRDHAHLQGIVQKYQEMGFLTAIDDFGAGYAGLNLLAEFQTDLVKLDMALIRNIHQDRTRQIICRGIVGVCQDLGMRVIGEGVEEAAEARVLRDMGVSLFQGYYFARPALGAEPEIPASVYDDLS